MTSFSTAATFSQSLASYDSRHRQAAASASFLARREFFGDGRGDGVRLGCNNSSRAMESDLYVPSSVRCPPQSNPFDSALGTFVPFADALRSVRSRYLPSRSMFDGQDEFEWLDQANNSSGESSSRKVAAKESAKRDIDNFFFMYFRVRMDNYIALVTALKQSFKDESIFNEESLDRWTHKYKFKTRRAAPLKRALMAFSSRMGLENDPDVMFCVDGFYGDAFAGRTYNKNEVPNNRVLPANTSLASGLRNGANIFVSRITNAERNNAIAQLQLDLLRGNDPEDEDEVDDPAHGSPGTTSESKDAAAEADAAMAAAIAASGAPP